MKNSADNSSEIHCINIEEHFGLVHLCCQKFRQRGLEYDDIFQCGCIGLTKAAKKFDVSKGLKFSTYAVPVILGEIKTLFRSSGAVKISRNLKDLSVKVKYECERFIAASERHPTLKELSEIMNVDTPQILEALEVCHAPISLDAPCFERENTGMNIPVECEEEKISLRISVQDAMNSLGEKDKNLIYLRFFKGATQSKTAKKLGMSQVQVSRREKTLLKVLREKLA